MHAPGHKDLQPLQRSGCPPHPPQDPSRHIVYVGKGILFAFVFLTRPIKLRNAGLLRSGDARSGYRKGASCSKAPQSLHAYHLYRSITTALPLMYGHSVCSHIFASADAIPLTSPVKTRTPSSRNERAQAISFP